MFASRRTIEMSDAAPEAAGGTKSRLGRMGAVKKSADQKVAAMES